MKKSIKGVLALFGAAVMLTSALAVNASAGDVYASNIIKKNTSSTSILSDTKECVYENGFYYDGKYYYFISDRDCYDSYRYVSGSSSGVKKYSTDEVGRIIKPESSTLAGKSDPNAEPDCIFKNGVYTTSALNYSVICGGKYYTNAAAELKNYFAVNTYDFSMKVGEERILCEDAMFYSLDANVVSYDAATGALVANGVGSTSVYVYTRSGLPFLRLDITVTKARTIPSQVELYADDWNLTSVGASTGFVVKSPAKYSDIVLDIVYGSNRARISDGKLIAKGYGPVVVRAYSKSNPLVYGETIVYIGRYTAPVYDGYWYTSGSDICVNVCPYSFWNTKNCYINGWIKTTEGIMIPVIKIQGATVTRRDGTIDSTIIVSGGTISLDELLKDCYGNPDDISGIIKHYHDINCSCKNCRPVVKPIMPTKPTPSTPSIPSTPSKPSTPSASNDHLLNGNDIDSIRLFISQILGAIGEK